MFATCLHCHSSLGRNELIEHFPIGRRLAFDAAKGRLWVVCGKCHRWNLTPLEERWEAIEECERLYSGTTLRASTDNIGLARLSEGLEVVRIGAPKVPEMAAWRYARDFGRRWIRNGLPMIALGGGGYTGLQAALATTPTGAFVALGVMIATGVITMRGARARIALPNGKVVRIPGGLNWRLCLEPAGATWALNTGDMAEVGVISGAAAVPALRSVITARNFGGAPKRDVEAAIAHLADARGPDQFITKLARASRTTGIHSYPPDIAVALEMALHEDTERAALEGELTQLRDEWELAEEIARIADDMLLPDSIRDRHRAMTREG